MYKYTNDMLPSVMHEVYKKNNEIHTYATRNKDLFRINRGQKGLNIYVYSYSNISARLWNALKLISSIPKKNSAFCLKTSYFMNKSSGNFASGAVWHTIAFKVSAFHFFWPKTY